MKPLGDNVILEKIGKLPELYRCKVLAVGPGLQTPSGRVKPQVRKGDVVLIKRWPVAEFPDPDDPKRMLLVVSEYQIRVKE